MRYTFCLIALIQYAFCLSSNSLVELVFFEDVSEEILGKSAIGAPLLYSEELELKNETSISFSVTI